MEAVLFVFGAAAALIGALGVVLARNPVHAALSLLVTMVTMSLFFLMQDAALVAAVQIVVYASAIVVLFLFVITLLGVDRVDSFEDSRRFQLYASLGLGAAAFVLIVAIAGGEWVTGAESTIGTLDEPRQGNVRRLAEALFTEYIWAFEITAVLLVIAVVGAVVLARRSPRIRPVGRGSER